MTKLVSLDTSTTATGACLRIDGEIVEYKTLIPKTKSPTEKRIMEMAKLITDTLNEWEPDFVYAETPQGHNNIKLSRMLGQMLGVVIGWCANTNCEFTEVNPSWWRKWNYWDQGKLTREELKKMSINKALEVYGIDVKNDDNLSDAIHIGEAAINYANSLNQ